MAGRRVMGWLVVLVMMLLACCGLPTATASASADECAEKKWLAEQRERAVKFGKAAEHLEQATREQIRDLDQLARRLAADLHAVEAIAKQIECIEAELRNSKCHPVDVPRCSRHKLRTRPSRTRGEAHRPHILKAHQRGRAAQITQQARVRAAKEQLKRIEAVECDIKPPCIQLIEKWQHERDEAEH